MNITNNNSLPEPTPASGHYYIYSLYIFSLFSFGASAQNLYLLARTTKTGWKNTFVILPFITLITATSYIFLDLQRAFSGGFDDETSRQVSVAQYLLDFPSSVALQLALWLRLRVLLRAESKLGSFPILEQLSKILLVIPFTWIIADIMGIIGLYKEDYLEISVKIVGIYNILTGVYDILLHSGFIYLFVSRIPSMKKNKQQKKKIIAVAVFICLNSVGLAFGGIYSFFDAVAGYVIIYSTWLVEVFVFMMLNDIVGSILKASKITKTVSM